MRNIAYQAIIFGMLSSLTTAEYTGNGNSHDDGYGKSGFDSTNYDGFVGDYAGQLGAGKALGEPHGYGESEHTSQQYDEGEHGSPQFEEEESHSQYGNSFGQQDEDGHKFGNNDYERFGANLDLSKFPIDVEAEHYTGADLSNIGIGEDEHQQEQQYENHHDYQSDDEGDHTAKQQSAQYNPEYSRYHDHVSMQIVPYSGYEEAEQEQHSEQPALSSGYEKSQQSDEDEKDPRASSESHEPPKEPSESYGPSYESAKVPSSSHESNYEDQKEPSPTYSPSYEFVKATSLGSYESLGGKYQYSLSPSKPSDYSHNVKSFHATMPKDVIAISHGKGGFSYSSLYRS